MKARSALRRVFFVSMMAAVLVVGSMVPTHTVLAVTRTAAQLGDPDVGDLGPKRVSSLTSLGNHGSASILFYLRVWADALRRSYIPFL